MAKILSIFKTPESQAKYIAAYDTALSLWPVPYESFYVPTRFGKTHIIASGLKGASPLVLLHATSVSATMWFPNIADLSREFRVYMLDIIGDAGKNVVSYPPKNKSDYALWLTDVFNELNVTQADVVGASYGGWVTLSLALYALERVKKIDGEDVLNIEQLYNKIQSLIKEGKKRVLLELHRNILLPLDLTRADALDREIQKKYGILYMKTPGGFVY